MVLQLIPCSPRGGALLRPSFHRRWFVRPGWADEPPQDLTPASGVGPHGFAVRFDIVRPARPSKAHRLNLMAACPANSDHTRYRRVHRISSRVCDDRETPLVWDETKRVIGRFEQKENKNIFSSGAGQPRNTRARARLLLSSAPQSSGTNFHDNNDIVHSTIDAASVLGRRVAPLPRR